MSLVTITSTIGTTCQYWLTPHAAVSTTGAGVVVPDIVHGWLYETSDNTPVTLSVQLDNSYLWDISLHFENAPPIDFDGFVPGSGGDLLTLLTAQGWVSL